MILLHHVAFQGWKVGGRALLSGLVDQIALFVEDFECLPGGVGILARAFDGRFDVVVCFFHRRVALKILEVAHRGDDLRHDERVAANAGRFQAAVGVHPIDHGAEERG